MFYSKILWLILLGFRYIAASIPVLCFVGVAVGVGLIFASCLLSLSRNPSYSSDVIRWAFIGFSLVEISGFIGLIFSFLILYSF